MEKHLYYYALHSQYVEPTDKPAVSYCELENEVHYAAGSVTLIAFTIGSTSYQAEEGMTWGDWVNSSYNTNEFVVRGDDNAIVDTAGFNITDSDNKTVYTTYVIVAGYAYHLKMIG